MVEVEGSGAVFFPRRGWLPARKVHAFNLRTQSNRKWGCCFGDKDDSLQEGNTGHELEQAQLGGGKALHSGNCSSNRQKAF